MWEMPAISYSQTKNGFARYLPVSTGDKNAKRIGNLSCKTPPHIDGFSIVSFGEDDAHRG